MVRPTEVPTAEEVRALIAASSGRGPVAVRNRAVLAVLWRGGLRISEALSLHPRDIDREAGTLRVRRGKGGSERLVVIDGEALAHLDLWLEVRAGLGANGRQPLFCSVSTGEKRRVGDALDPSYFRRLIPKLAKKAGIEKRCHAHALRHAHAAELVSRGVPLTHIRDQLGHSNAATTEQYLGKVAPQERIDRLRAAGMVL